MSTKKYRAYYYPKGSTFRAGLVAVLAEDEQEARRRIREELRKPGRWTYLQYWQDSGAIVEPVDVEELS